VLRKALKDAPENFDMQNVPLTFALKTTRRLRWAYAAIRFRARQGGINSINLPKIIRTGWRMLVGINQVAKAKS